LFCALREPVPVAPHVREAAVAAALVETTGAGGVVRRMATARRARAGAGSGSARRMSAASAAAALLVAVGVGGFLLSRAGGTTDPLRTTSGNALAAGQLQPRTKSANPTPARNAQNNLGAATEDQAASPALASGGTSEAGAGTAGFYNAGDIGDYTATQPIVERYRAYLAGGGAKDGSYMDASPCPTPEDRSVLWHAELTYNGIEAYARILTKGQTDQSDQVLEVLSRSTCALVESQAI
jgi:hypothetical protein